jgi:hypothetical protein
MGSRMILRWWWARLTGRTITPPQAFELEKMHITRHLSRVLGSPVSDAERQWWRAHFGQPDGYVGADGAPNYRHTNLIDMELEARWGRLSPQAQAASWVDWERRGLAERTALGLYEASVDGGVTVLQEMWETRHRG